MPKARITDSKISQPQFDTMTAPLEQDLFAYFKVLEELIMSETFDDEKSPEQLIDDITEFLLPSVDTGAIIIKKSERIIKLQEIQKNMLRLTKRRI